MSLNDQRHQSRHLPILPLSLEQYQEEIQSAIFSLNLQASAKPEKLRQCQFYLNDLSMRAESPCGSLRSYLSIKNSQSMRMLSGHRHDGTARALEGHCPTQAPGPLRGNCRFP